MADFEKLKTQSLATVDAALTIVNKYPEEIPNTSTYLSFDTSSNPFTYLMDLFKSVAGFNVFLNVISLFIVEGVPVLEAAVKSTLLLNMKNIFSCSGNPIITEKLIREGVIFDLRTLDLMNMLRYCPLDTRRGRYFYFGCDGFVNTEELMSAGDFDAFLWYVKNKAFRRQVWYGVDTLTDSVESIDKNFNNSYTILQKGPIEGQIPPQRKKDEDIKKDDICKKTDGIVTLQYYANSSDIRDAEGRPINEWVEEVDGEITRKGSTIQIPHNNCLQVFLGNVQEAPPSDPDKPDFSQYEREIREIDNQISELKKQIKDSEEKIEIHKDKIDELNTQRKKNEIENQFNYDYEIGIHKKAIADEKSKIEDNEVLIEDAAKAKILKETDFRTALNEGGVSYRTVRQNYYYNRPLFQFNTDYIMSLKLFDSKVIASKLIDALTNCISVDLHLSYEQLLIKYETEELVKKVLESDESVVSDCFFTFTNDDYNRMLQKAELVREGLYANNHNETTGMQVDAESLLNSLNTINEGTSKEVVLDTIDGCLREISASVSQPSFTENDKVNYGARMNFIENLMNNLAYVVTETIISPKVYLLMAINFQLFGRETDIDINDFLERYRQVITEIIRTIRDALLNYFVDAVKDMLNILVKKVAAKMALEQSAYYTKLITKLRDCFKSDRKKISSITDFEIDDVDYADIFGEEEEPIENEC